jgi:ubiquinone/menaquinone biosynthesis C-methylase UbiE
MTERTSHRHFVPCMGGSALTPFYDILHRFSGLGAVHEKMISMAELQPGQRVLDIGCGTGNLLLALGRVDPGVEIEGLDPDARALAKAARKAHRAGVAASWRPGYAQDLPHADGSVDRVFSSLMLHHMPDDDDKDALLAEVRRVLRPDGLLVLADIDGHSAVDGHGFLRRRMAHNPMIHDNAGMVERIKAAGFAVEAPVEHRLRMGRITIVRARPGER